jgi:Amt family ammonium transporter
VHGVGGLAGALLTGVFAQKVLNDAGNDGLLFGNPHQLVVQGIASLATGGYAAVVTFVVLKAIDKTIGLRVDAAEEREGLDQTQHGEEGYAG